VSQPPQIGLLMTTGMSLKAWANVGFLDRELAIYRRLAERMNVRIVFISYGGADEIEYLRGEECFGVVPKASPRLSDLAYSFTMGTTLRGIWRQLSLLKTNQMRGAWAGIPARRFWKVPFVVRCGFEWLQYASYRQEESFGRKRPVYFKMVAGAERRVYKRADAIMLPGQAAYDFVRERFRIPEDKMHIFLNSIDLERFAPRPELRPIEGRVIFVGRLNRVKRLDLLIRAMADIDGTDLQVVGEGEDREDLEALAGELDVPTLFHGRVPNQVLPETLAYGQVFVLPSVKEGNPKALMEAMACGRPCIATAAPGNTDLIRHEETGLLVSDDPEAISQAIRRVLDNPDWAAEMGKRARSFAEQHFDINVNLDREAALLGGLMRKLD